MNATPERGSFTPDDISAWFWDVIERAECSRERLEAMLREMPRQDIIRFHDDFQEAAVQLVDEPFIDHMDEELSEDGIQDVAEWVVSQGKETYTDVWENPDHVPKRVEPGTTTTFSSVADNVFWDRFNEPVPEQT